MNASGSSRAGGQPKVRKPLTLMQTLAIVGLAGLVGSIVLNLII